jgi:hypothetical protein
LWVPTCGGRELDFSILSKYADRIGTIPRVELEPLTAARLLWGHHPGRAVAVLRAFHGLDTLEALELISPRDHARARRSVKLGRAGHGGGRPIDWSDELDPFRERGL